MLQIGFRSVRHHRNSDAFVAFGVYETSPPKGYLGDFVVPTLISFRDGDPLTVMIEEQPYSLDSITSKTVRPLSSRIEDMTLEDILKIEAERPIHSSHSNAHLVCRPTKIEPSENGRIVYAFMGFAHAPIGNHVGTSSVYLLKCLPTEFGFGRSCLFLEGVLGSEFRPELGEIDLSRDSIGTTFEQLMRRPWWGFSSEPHSLPGTFSPEVYDDLAVFYRRFNEGASTDSDPDFETLVARIRALGCDGVLRDPLFASYLKQRIADEGVESLVSPIPLSKFISRSRSVKALVHTLLQP